MKYKPPLVCVAGGPLLPCTYLIPLVHLVADRAIVVYDAIGCGQSSKIVQPPLPSNPENNKLVVQDMVDDLESLINHLECNDFHLYGHSFGGILVYEYLKKVCSQATKPSKTCRTAILASTPLSIAGSDAYCQKIMDDIREELPPDDQDNRALIQQTFHQRHECRVQPLPLPLQQSFQMAGFSSSSLTGLKSVRDYAVSVDDLTEETRALLPVALILRGEYDFVTADVCHEWGKIFPSNTCMTVAGCSHYGMVEQESLYGRVLTSFLQQHDPAMKPLFPKK